MGARKNRGYVARPRPTAVTGQVCITRRLLQQPPLPTIVPKHCCKKPGTPEQELLDLEIWSCVASTTYPVPYPLPTSTCLLHKGRVCKPTCPLASIKVSSCIGFGNKASEFSYFRTWPVGEAQTRDRGYVTCGRYHDKRHVTERSERGPRQPPLRHTPMWFRIVTGPIDGVSTQAPTKFCGRIWAGLASPIDQELLFRRVYFKAHSRRTGAWNKMHD